MSKQGYVAFDLGAESGRAMLSWIDGGKLKMEEVHRFANRPRYLPSGYHWSLMELWGHLLDGLKNASDKAKTSDIQLVSLGVDTWGVDHGFIGNSGQLLGLPYAYRDDRHAMAMEKTFTTISKEELYSRTGIQILPFNSIFQLVAQQEAEPAVLDQARRILFMPDLLHYFFCGNAVNESTIVSTSQMVDPRTGSWDTELLQKLNLPTNMLGQIVDAGTVIGKTTDAVNTHAGIDPASALDVVVPGSHDTASAVAAVPVSEEHAASGNWAYLSSGTWSLLGAEIDEPKMDEACLTAGFTNEGAVGNKIRFLRNIAGLWLVQQIRADFAKRGETYDYAKLTQMAAESEPFRTLVNPNHGPFMLPGEMCAKFIEFAQATDQPAPETPGQFVRCCLETLALCYRDTLLTCESLLDKSFEVLHIVGGGGQNLLLNQMTADALNRPVIVGPYEATAIGNALTQAMGLGQVNGIAGLRQIVRDSFELTTYTPQNADGFDKQFDRYKQITTQ